MVNLVEEISFWEFIAEKNTYIQHQPNTSGLTNRFARFNEEGTIGELTDLGWPRLELRDTPNGKINDNNAGYIWDELSRSLRIITKVERNNFTVKAQAQQDCKAALLQVITYIKGAQDSGQCCNSNILCMFDANSISYQVIEYATADASFTGVEMRIKLKATFNPDEVTYGPYPDYPNTLCDKIKQCLGINPDTGDAAKFLNEQGEWITVSGDGDLSAYYTKLQTDSLLAGKSNTSHTHNISEVTGLQSALNDKADGDDLSAHVSDSGNPHQTTLEQVRSIDNFFEGEVDMNGNSLRNVPNPTNDDEAVNYGTVKALIDTTIKALEGYNPAGGTYPTTYGGNAIKKGDSFKITANGSVNTIAVKTGDFLIALVDAPGQTDANWQIGQANVDQATESVQGIAKVASQTDVQNELTTNNTDIVTPQKLWFGLLRMLAVSLTWTAKQVFNAAPRLAHLSNGNRYLKTDTNKDITEVASIPATDVTEDSTHRFATDAEKTTWNAKQAALGYTPEDAANKGTAMSGNTGSNTIYLTAKAVYDWATATFQSALGYTPENTANKATGYSTVDNTKFPTTQATDNRYMRILYSDLTERSLNGTTNGTGESLFNTAIALPLNINSMYLRITIFFRVSVYSAGTPTFRLRIGTNTGTPSANTLIAQNAVGSVNVVPVIRNMHLSTGLLETINTSGNISSDESATASYASVTPDFTQQQYLFITGTPSNAGNTIKCMHVLVEAFGS